MYSLFLYLYLLKISKNGTSRNNHPPRPQIIYFKVKKKWSSLLAVHSVNGPIENQLNNYSSQAESGLALLCHQALPEHSHP